MFNIIVVNAKYVRLGKHSIYIGRGAGRYTPSPLKNKFIVGRGYAVGEAFTAHREWFMDKAKRKDFSPEERLELRRIYNMAQTDEGVQLVCHCKDPNQHRDCHGDTLKAYLEYLYNANHP